MHKEKRVHISKYLAEKGRLKHKDMPGRDVEDLQGDRHDEESDSLLQQLRHAIGELFAPGKAIPPGPRAPSSLRDWLMREVQSAGLDAADFQQGAKSAFRQVELVIAGKDARSRNHAAVTVLDQLKSPNVSYSSGIHVVRDAIQEVGLGTFPNSGCDAGKGGGGLL